MESRRQLKLKFEHELSRFYVVEWDNDKEESPLRIKPKQALEKEQLKTKILRWINTLSTVANTKAVQTGQYVRINIPSSGKPMCASVYGNGTIMFQGKGHNIENWLKSKVDEICSLIKRRNSMDKSKDEILEKSTQQDPDCPICQNKQTDDMVQCKTCDVWVHYDCDVDKVIEDQVEKTQYMCPSCRKSSSVKNKHTPLLKSKSKRTLRTRAVSKKISASQSNKKQNNISSESNLDDTFTIDNSVTTHTVEIRSERSQESDAVNERNENPNTPVNSSLAEVQRFTKKSELTVETPCDGYPEPSDDNSEETVSYWEESSNLLLVEDISSVQTAENTVSLLSKVKVSLKESEDQDDTDLTNTIKQPQTVQSINIVTNSSTNDTKLNDELTSPSSTKEVHKLNDDHPNISVTEYSAGNNSHMYFLSLDENEGKESEGTSTFGSRMINHTAGRTQ